MGSKTQNVLTEIADMLELYADSYERMAKQNKSDPRINMTSVAVDIRQNMKGFVLEKLASRAAVANEEQCEHGTPYKFHCIDCDGTPAWSDPTNYTAITMEKDSEFLKIDLDQKIKRAWVRNGRRGPTPWTFVREVTGILATPKPEVSSYAQMWSYECVQPGTDGKGWHEFYSREKPNKSSGIRNIRRWVSTTVSDDNT